MIVSQNEYNASLQSYRDINIKLEVLDYTFYIVNEISGITENATFNVDADSDIRRTCNVSIIIKDDYSQNENFNDIYWSSGNQYWFDKYLKISLGIRDITTQEMIWSSQGIYLINEPSLSYDASTNTLSFQGVDLMSKLTGMRDGNLSGLESQIPINSNIKNAMISLLAEQGFYEYYIEEPPQNITPYEINVDAGATTYDLLSALRDINPNWEMFFDINGRFVFQPIAGQTISTNNTTPIVNAELSENIIISYNLDTSFEDVKNYIEVYGGIIETNLSATAVVSDSDVNLTLSNAISDLENDTIYDILFTIGDTQNTPILLSTQVTDINIVENGSNITTLNISDNPILYNNWDYVLRISKNENDEFTILSYLGYLQTFGMAWEDNTESPFYVGDVITSSPFSSSTDAIHNKPKFKKQIRIVLSGGEYDNITSNKLAMERADYELYMRARRHDTINMSIVPLYWLDVNQILEYKLPNEDDKSYWLMKSISTNFSVDGVQSINAIRLLPSIE